jgi:hypothetical protein
MYSNEIYFFGGYTFRNGDYFNDLHRLKLTNNNKQAIWTQLPLSGDTIDARVDHSFIAANEHQLYVFGGRCVM